MVLMSAFGGKADTIFLELTHHILGKIYILLKQRVFSLTGTGLYETLYSTEKRFIRNIELSVLTINKLQIGILRIVVCVAIAVIPMAIVEGIRQRCYPVG